MALPGIKTRGSLTFSGVAAELENKRRLEREISRDAARAKDAPVLCRNVPAKTVNCTSRYPLISCKITGNRLILPRKDELTVLLTFNRSSCPLDERVGNLTQESFDRLLAWLHEDRDEAGRIYENIRSSLIAGFRSHGCSFSDKLADQTIDRVAKKLAEMIQPYVGDPRPYFYRVAFYVRLEHLRKEVAVEELPADLNLPAVAEDVEPEFECLEQCMDTLPPHSRDIVLKYYQGEKRVKIELRKALASSLNLSLPALRLKAQRIRAHLKTCIKACLLAKSRLQDSIPPFNTTGAIVEFESEA